MEPRIAPAAEAGQVMPEHQAQNYQNSQDRVAMVKCGDLPLFLPIPTDEDDLETTASKLHDLADVVSGGNSLALTSGQTATHQNNAEDFAKERMRPSELMQYEAWKEQSVSLPAFNWVAHVKPVPPGALKTFSQRAVAMTTIWKGYTATPENAVWLTDNYPYLLPLVKAVTKVVNAQSHLEKHNPFAGLNAREVIEIQALHLINLTAEKNLARERARVRDLMESVHQSLAVIRDRLEILGK
ncbi:hypothetical protein N7462_006574 [Penicillium macrosclerotiorum]|uniref:uncharacterized protein n=1 Tax=Penicillium macrosclerotiorum TaxID=303699 RepID=UPI002548C25C|nr:uncharacterized protein N7462_006574 [Penicillium macrosclerotiorum]KAJ5683409.1 hypothetical protein N7462_006574 [Penicillium macrosclerotiorum]